MFFWLHAEPGLRGLKRWVHWVLLMAFLTPSIQPRHSASMTACYQLIEGAPEDFL